MNLKYISRYLIAVLFTVLFSSVNAQEPIVLDKIVVKVGNSIILKSTVERSYLDFISRGNYASENVKCQILTNQITRKLMVEKAIIDSVLVEDEEVSSELDQRLSYIISQVGSEKELEAYYGKTIEEFKVELFDEIKEQITIRKMEGEVVSNIKVTPSEVRKFFKAIPKDSIPFYSAEVALAQIVMTPKANAIEEQRVKDFMLDLRSKIISGEADFADLARKYSEDPGSGAKGGELGFMKRGQLVPPFEAAIFSMKKGEISDPVKSQFGYHMIQLHERLGNTYKSRHILIAPKPQYEDFEETKEILDSIADLARTGKMSFENAAKEHSEDKKTSSSGGFFLDNTGAQRLSVEALTPDLFFTIDTMKTGVISNPMRFKKEDGKEALRLLYYKDRVPPHQGNLKQDYSKIQQAVKQSKKNTAMSDWFSEAKNELYIEIDPEYSHCNILGK